MVLDPWTIGDISDYEHLFKQFGISPMDAFKAKYSDLRYIRRGIIFGHRGFDKIDAAISNKKPFIMMTGLMPSGNFHFGHKMVADEIIWLQGKGARTYIAAADIESYLMRGVSLSDAKKIAVEEYLTNYIALGLDPKKTSFWFQSDYASPYYRLADQAAKEVTFNEMKAIYGDLSTNKIISALKQVADILHPQLPEFEGRMPTVVPVGADQDPHIRLTRDIAYRLNHVYKMEQPSATFHRFMEGLQGGKMSSSDPKSHIALSEEPKSARKKIMSATTGGRATLEEQKKLGGVPESCAVYKFYLYHFVDDDKELQKIFNECRSGAVMCGDCKKRCADMMESFLNEHQKKREKAKGEAKKLAESSLNNRK
jgi:tryptophanyl-tRNA synthetase